MPSSDREQKFIEWWGELEPRLLLLGRRMLRSPDLARELAQDLALIAFDRFDEFSSPEHFQAFLLTRGRWLALDRLRRDNTQARLLEKYLESGSYSEAYETESDLADVLRACNELPQAQRSVLVRTLLGFSDIEISRELDVAPSTVRSLRRFAKRRLIELLNRAEDSKS